MSRLIDADKMIEHLDLCLAESDSSTLIVDATLAAIKHYVENAPTVDAVEVVRCKDCAYWDKISGGFAFWAGRCTRRDSVTGCDYFCGSAERSTE